MDTKKLFEYEFQLESMKPQMTENELLHTLKNTEALNSEEVEKIASFNITAGEDGFFLKFSDSNGKQKKLQFLNPVVAKTLASELINSLSAQGYIEDDIIEIAEISAGSLH